MTLTIGRASLTDSEVVDYSFSGDTLTITGQIVPVAGSSNTVNQARFNGITQQLRGLQNNADESVFPITWTVDPGTIDGFYSGFSATVDPVPGVASVPVFATWSVTATRITGYASAQVRVDTLVGVRTNGHGTTTTTGIVAANPYALHQPPGESTFTSTTQYLTSRSASGTYGSSMNILTKSISATTSGVTTYLQTPALYYGGACMVEYLGADNAWYPIVGRQAPGAIAGRWRITNNIFGLECETSMATNGLPGVMKVNAGSGHQVGRVASLNQYAGIPGALGGNCWVGGAEWVEPSIIRNDPECVVVRCYCYDTNGQHAQTFTVHRGQMFVEVQFTSTSATYRGLAFATTTGSTNLTGATGLRETADNTDGDRVLLMGAEVLTKDTTNGYVWNTTAATTTNCAVGMEYGGSTASALNDRSAVLGQYLATYDATASVVRF